MNLLKYKNCFTVNKNISRHKKTNINKLENSLSRLVVQPILHCCGKVGRNSDCLSLVPGHSVCRHCRSRSGILKWSALLQCRLSASLLPWKNKISNVRWITSSLHYTNLKSICRSCQNNKHIFSLFAWMGFHVGPKKQTKIKISLLPITSYR